MVPMPRREPLPVRPAPVAVAPVVPAPAPVQEEKARTATKHRWWFWPLFVLILSPPAATITAFPMTLGRMGRFNNLLEAWASAGMLGGMVLLIGIGVRLPAMARFLCMLPIAGGLIAAGALANQALGPRPVPDDLVRVSIAALFPLFILLVEAATVVKQWRLWITLTVLVAVIATLHYGRFLGSGF